MKFHHIALIVSDKNRSLEFYQQLLGFKILRESYRSERSSWKIDLERDGMRLELFTFPGAPTRPSYPEAQGLRHLAFAVSNLEEWHKMVEARGGRPEAIRLDGDTGKRFFFFQDPDELPIEFYEE